VMGVRILEGEYDGGPGERAILVDSVTERPLALPMFECAADAEGFLRWFLAEGHGDPRGATFAVLDLAHTLWVKSRCEACYALDCACKSCGSPCTQPCAAECRAESDLALDMRGA
jgi:hypothetical protein